MHNIDEVKRLQQGLKGLNLALEEAPFLDYLHLLHQWNQAYNLTAVRTIDAMIIRHVLDSLAIISWVRGPLILDVGSGAGLPGIPLALARPDWQIVLLDSNGKKIRFMQEAVRTLKLSNVKIAQSRVESYHPLVSFDTVMSRAFSDLAQMMDWTAHLLAPNGIWLAMKGRYPDNELNMINSSYNVQPYTVPNLKEERCCVIINKPVG